MASKERVKNWDNTVSGQCRKRLERRAQKLLQEEEQRRELDEIFAKETKIRDQQIIDKTKQLQYVGSDLVKNFHSRLVLLEVLQERDLQIERKKNKGSSDSNLDVIYSKMSLEKLKNELQEEKIQQECKKAAKVEIAKEQLQQYKKKLDLKKAERESFLLEGQKIAELDQNYKSLQKEQDSKKREKAVSLRNELDDMKKLVIQRKEAQRTSDLEYEEKINAWKTRKDLQNQKKKELSDKWFSEGLNRSLALGETQHLISSNADAKLHEQITLRVKERDSKALKESAEVLTKKQKRQAEIKQFYLVYMKNKDEKKVLKKEADKKELEAYIKLRDDYLAQKEAVKSEKLNSGKTLQSFHKSQILSNEAAKSARFESEKAQGTYQSKLANTETETLKAYMIAVSKEPWAASNPRLLAFIKDEVSEKPRVPRLAEKYRVDTTSRLGFDTKYQGCDFLRTNPIVTGNAVLYK